MGIEIVDLVDMAHKEKRRKNIFNKQAFTPGCIITSPDRRTPCTAITPTRPSSFWTANAP